MIASENALASRQRGCHFFGRRAALSSSQTSSDRVLEIVSGHACSLGVLRSEIIAACFFWARGIFFAISATKNRCSRRCVLPQHFQFLRTCSFGSRKKFLREFFTCVSQQGFTTARLFIFFARDSPDDVEFLLNSFFLRSSKDLQKTSRAHPCLCISASFVALKFALDSDVFSFLCFARCDVQGQRCKLRRARCEAQVARCEVQGARCEVRGARIVRGAMSEVRGRRCEVRGARCGHEVRGARCKLRRAWHEAQVTRCEVQGARNEVWGARIECAVRGVRCVVQVATCEV